MGATQVAEVSQVDLKGPERFKGTVFGVEAHEAFTEGGNHDDDTPLVVTVEETGTVRSSFTLSSLSSLAGRCGSLLV